MNTQNNRSRVVELLKKIQILYQNEDISSGQRVNIVSELNAVLNDEENAEEHWRALRKTFTVLRSYTTLPGVVEECLAIAERK